MNTREPQDHRALRWAALRELLGETSSAATQARLVKAGLLCEKSEVLLPAGLGLAFNELAVRLGTHLPVAALQRTTDVAVLRRGALSRPEHEELRVLRALLPRWLELEQRIGLDGLLVEAEEPPGLPEHLAHLMPTPPVPLTFGGSQTAAACEPRAALRPPVLRGPSLADALEALMPGWLARNRGVTRAAYEMTVGATQVEVVVTIPQPGALEEA